MRLSYNNRNVVFNECCFNAVGPTSSEGSLVGRCVMSQVACIRRK